MKLVSVFMDVEDPINPLADDAALDFPRLFDEVGIRGSFCLTGEKCRSLTASERFDVSDAFKPHCLGLHTDTHSYHPTTMELLAELDFEQGCRAAYDAEKPGFDAFLTLFGRKPAFWGGAGNTWSPEITESLKTLGIPAYSYALTALPDEAVHRFNDVVALPQALSISEDDWADDERAEAASERALDAIERIPQPWIGIFVGHPTRFRHIDYWDTAFYGGRTPACPEFAKPVSTETYSRSKRNLESFLRVLAQRVSVVGVDEALEQPWIFRLPTVEESDYFAQKTSSNLRGAINWPIHRPNLSAEKIVSKTLGLANTIKIGNLS